MATTSSIQSDASGNIDLCDIPAVIKWDDGQPRIVGSSLSSTPVSLDIDFNSHTTISSFRLRIALLQRGSDKIVPLFVLIGSPQIQVLATSRPDQTTDGAASPDRDTVCLRFQLSSPPTLVVPHEAIRWKDRSQLTILRSVEWAARQTVLTVLIRDQVLSAHQLRGLQEADYARYTSSSRHMDLGRLYGGRGGKIMDAGADDATTMHAPPSYNDVPAPPPMAPISYGSDTATSSKKRPRLDSPSDDLDVSVIEQLCRKIADEHYERTRVELSNMETRLLRRLDQGMSDRVKDLQETSELKFQKLEGQMRELRNDFDTKTQEIEIGSRELDDASQLEYERLNERIQEISNDIDNRVDLEVEDRVLGIKVDLEDFVRDELSATADTLKQRISEASVYIEFKN